MSASASAGRWLGLCVVVALAVLGWRALSSSSPGADDGRATSLSPEVGVARADGSPGDVAPPLEGGAGSRVGREPPTLSSRRAVTEGAPSAFEPQTPGPSGVPQPTRDAPLGIRGVVLDLQGEPVAGASVRAYVDLELAGIVLPLGVTSEERFGSPRSKSDRDGSFFLGPLMRAGAAYVVRAEKRVGVSILKYPAREESGDEPRHWVGGLEGVLPGPEPVTVVLQQTRDQLGSLRLELSAAGGPLLPKRLPAVLRQVGPNGSVYQRQELSLPVDPEGAVRSSGLIPGQRYTLTLSASVDPSEPRLGPFIALQGEVVLRAVLPGLHEVRVRVVDPQGRVPGHAKLSVLGTHESGARITLDSVSMGKPNREHVLRVPAGEYFVHVGARVWNSRGRLQALPDHPIRVPAEGEVVTILVP